MKHLCIISFFSIAFTLLLLQSATAFANERPNVIIVMTDDQGYGDLSCHGNPILKTPNLDRLYTDSIRFTDFHVSPFCTPTRAALMTGNHAGYTGAFRTSSGRTMMHRDEKTIADLYASAGYATGMVGKWHLGDNAPHRPQDRGFQDVVWHRCGGVGQASDYWGNDYFDDTYERNGKFEKFEGYCTDVWFREGMRFIEKNQSKPFLLYLATNAPHGPYRVPPEWAEPYSGNRDVVNPNFFGMIANLDHNMGLLRKQLDDLELSEKTILVFMTDNGTSAGFELDRKDPEYGPLDSHPVRGFNAGMRGRKSSVYEGGHRVPFFVHWPKGNLTGGKDIDTLAAHIDVLPTLAGLCGIPLTDEYDVDGLSLVSLLTGSEEPWQRSHLIEQYLGGAGGNALPPKPFEYTVVMTEQWRLVNSGKERLFDIQTDPGQHHDLAADNNDVMRRLRELYEPFWQRVSPRLKPVRIDIGNPAQNPTELCSQDWYMTNGNPPWNFGSIKKLPRVVGPWMLHVHQDGRYRITLRQFPKVANKTVVAKQAKIEIAGKTLEQAVPQDSTGVEFEIDLQTGPTELVTYLYDERGKAGGAYFTEVELMPGDSEKEATLDRSISKSSPPNFIVIFADDQGYEDVGCFGSPDIRTPRLDQMASEGIKFTDFYAQPVCGPSRAALMTGCYPMRVAERGNTKQVHPILHSKEITIAEILKTKGYATACFGKWDLAKHAQRGFFMDLFPTRQGFDYFYGTPTSNDSIANLYRNEEFIEPKSDMSTLTRRYTDEAIGFMKNNRDKPFFVYVPHTMPHTRLDASPDFKGKSKRGLYGDVIEEIDFNVGRILDTINELKLADSTYVIYTSDNGPWLIKNKNHADGRLPRDHGGSAGPLRSGKVSTFEGGVRVPCIVWGPGRVPAGKVCSSIASTLDVLPTFAALAGGEPPSDRVIDGEDIRHLLHGDFSKANNDKAYYYYLRTHLQAVRQGKWKLHLPRDKEPIGAAPFSNNRHIAPADRIGFPKPFLIDLENDLGETTDVSDQHPKVVSRLLQLAEAMREDLGDYDQAGKNMRFYDLDGPRPTKPPVPAAGKPKNKTPPKKAAG